MPNDPEDVRKSGKTGSERRAVKVTRLTPTETSRLRLAGTIRFSLLGRRHTDGTTVQRSIRFWTQIRPRLNQHRLGRTGARLNGELAHGTVT